MKEDAYMDGLLRGYLSECEAAQNREEWVDEHAYELMYDPEWLSNLDCYDLDKKNWQTVNIQMNQLPILFIENLSKLAPTWHQTWKNHKEVEQLLDMADYLYDLIKAKAHADAEDAYDDMRSDGPED